VAGSCEHDNEPSCSIKCGEFLDCLSVLIASQEGLCFMEFSYLVSWLTVDCSVAMIRTSASLCMKSIDNCKLLYDKAGLLYSQEKFLY
jgi:hypothetical protein